MRPWGLVVTAAALLSTAASAQGITSNPFDRKMPPDRQAVHVLNRLTFGARPGDLDEVRRIGIDAWIRRQLHPSSIPEDDRLEATLTSMPSLRLATWEIIEKYRQPQPSFNFVTPPLTELLTPEQRRQLTNGSGDERRAVLATLSAEARRQALSQLPSQAFEAFPDLKRAADKARLVEQEIRNRFIQEQQRRVRLPLSELLTPEQAVDLQSGTDEEKSAVLSALDPAKRAMVFRATQGQQPPEAFRREALIATNPQQAVAVELIDGKLHRALRSRRQLEEVLVDFWFNHFNVFSGKEPVRMLLTSYERDAIRPHVLGRFRDMLLATARHPAMLVYLDNYQSRAAPDPNVNTGGPRPGLNENYGRELLELHTLGVNGGYTQADVINVARAFTGWTVFEPNRYGEFQFNPAMHDRGEKTVLGHLFPRGGGEEEGIRILGILASHPSTARFIARKLAQRFVADEPPLALVNRMADTFRSTDGDLRAVMETLLSSREFLSEGAWRAKLKSPFEMVVSALRALDATVSDTAALAQRLSELGQPLYGKREPTGYPNTGEGWGSSAELLGRMNFSTALVAGQIAGVRVTDVEALASLGARQAMTKLAGVEPSGSILPGGTGVDDALTPELLVSVLLASPDFQKR